MPVADSNTSRTATIARLNDDARLGLDRRARVLFTSNCLETFRPTPETHLAFVQAELLKAFRHCEFAADSPEHDFASILHRDRKVWMKIDLYDPGLVKIALNGSFSSWAGGPHTQCSRIGFIRSEVS